MSEDAEVALNYVKNKVFANKDPIMQDLIKTESGRLREAMRTLGLEWNGTFNEGHLMTIAYAYQRMLEMMEE